MASYYHHFILGFALIAKPLHCLMKKEEKFIWTTECQQAFDEKNRLISAHTVAFLDYTQPFRLHTDVSLTTIGTARSSRRCEMTENTSLHTPSAPSPSWRRITSP